MRTMGWLFVLAMVAACEPTEAEECETSTWFLDADGDGYGDEATAREACEASEDEVALVGDCDDADADIHPDAAEHCDEVDEDCDGEIDEDVIDGTRFFVDADEDGHGGEDTVYACAVDDGLTPDGGDCNDADASIHPGAEEHCDDVDEDCDGEVDEDAVDRTEWAVDADGDGWGTDEVELACDAIDGLTDKTGDCNDADPTIHPGADDPVCDGIDHDCDGRTEAAMIGETPYSAVQSAVSAAPIGATVDVCPGVHSTSLRRDGDLVLQSRSGDPEDTIIEPSAGRGLEFSGDALTVRGLTFRGGYDVYEGGNLLVSSNVLLVEDCIVEDGVSDYEGGGLAWSSRRGTRGDVVIRDSIFRDNTADYSGGGLDTSGWAPYDLLIEGSTFDGNTSGYQGGGLNVSDTADESTESTVRFLKSSVTDNFADYEGGGMDIGMRSVAYVDVEDSEFSGNEATYSGGGISGGGSTPTYMTVDNSAFGQNESPRGACIQLGSWADDELTFRDSTISQHVGAGAIISLGGWGDGLLTLERASFLSNESGVFVGGRGDTYHVESEDTTFDGTTSGAALHVQGTGTFTGGAVRSNLAGLRVDDDLELDGVDLASGSTDNTDYDVQSPGADKFYTGVTSLVCVDGTCR